MSFRRARAVAGKEFLHLLRDPRSLFAALAIPLLLLTMFGDALTLDVDRIPALVYDHDGSPESRALIERFRGSRYFDVRGLVSSYAAIERAIDRGQILLGVVVARDYSRNLLSGRAAEVQLLIDGSDSNTASLALGYAEALVQTYALEYRTGVQNKRGAGDIKTPVEARLRVWYNEDLKSRNYIVPGLIALILSIIAALLTTLTIAREWENGTMEQLLSTPLRPFELIAGKLSAYFVLGLADTAIAILVGVFLFHVPMRGNAFFLLFSSCVFLLGCLCWGVFLSAVTRSQLLAYQIGLITTFLPAFLLSGFVFAIDNMPLTIQAITYLVPARYFVTILKGIFMRGVGFEVLWLEVLLLLIYAGALLAVATRELRQKVA